MVVLEGGAVSYVRGTPVPALPESSWARLKIQFDVQGYLAHKKTPTP